MVINDLKSPGIGKKKDVFGAFPSTGQSLGRDITAAYLRWRSRSCPSLSRVALGSLLSRVALGSLLSLIPLWSLLSLIPLWSLLSLIPLWSLLSLLSLLSLARQPDLQAPRRP